jgi:hypothetical protein
MAQAYLHTMGRQVSSLDWQRVRRFAAAMTDGMWHYDAATTPLTFDGPRCSNGAHRLQAVIESGCIVQFWVEKG